jgi:hypothetical protein
MDWKWLHSEATVMKLWICKCSSPRTVEVVNVGVADSLVLLTGRQSGVDLLVVVVLRCREPYISDAVIREPS